MKFVSMAYIMRRTYFNLLFWEANVFPPRADHLIKPMSKFSFSKLYIATDADALTFYQFPCPASIQSGIVSHFVQTNNSANNCSKITVLKINVILSGVIWPNQQTWKHQHISFDFYVSGKQRTVKWYLFVHKGQWRIFFHGVTCILSIFLSSFFVEAQTQNLEKRCFVWWTEQAILESKFYASTLTIVHQTQKLFEMMHKLIENI